MTPHENSTNDGDMLKLAEAQVVMLPIAYMRLLAQGKNAELVQLCLNGKNDIRGALVVLTAASRDGALVAEAEEAGLVEKLKGSINERLGFYLWVALHDDTLWLAEQSPAWKNALSSAIPWKRIFSKRTYKSEWNVAAEKFVTAWEPTKLGKYPRALQCMTNPSELHVLEAACGKDGGYMNKEQIDAIRPGASEWLKTRKMLVGGESPEFMMRAFRQWFRQGPVQGLDVLDPNVFEPGV